MVKFAQVLLVSILACIFSLSVTAQKKKVIQIKKATITVKKPMVKPDIEEKKVVAKTGVVDIQAGIVYQADGVQPVARGSFVFLDESLDKILQDAGLTKTERDENLVEAYAHSIRFPTLYGDFGEKATQALKPHIKQSFTTDFDGKATSTPLDVGTYYLVGYYRTRGGYAIWNYKIDVVAGQNKIILDQENAAISF